MTSEKTRFQLHQALELGYKVRRVMEIWHWPEDQRSNELLRPFIFELYKGKDYASGFPAHVLTQQDKEVALELYTFHFSTVLNFRCMRSK